MKEDFLHYVWKYQKFQTTTFQSTTHERLEVEQVGQHNQLEGPDFFNARIRIDGQLWAGNIEVHLRSSDWYAHGHERDQNYDSVILHVVWEHDVAVFRTNDQAIPTLELKHIVSPKAVSNYEIFNKNTFQDIRCEHYFGSVDPIIRLNWLQRLFIERLEGKSELILHTLSQNNYNWDALLFAMLCKNFGLQHNGASFYSIATSIDYSVVRKCAKKAFDLECLLFGLAGLLGAGDQDAYQEKMLSRCTYLKRKFQIEGKERIPAKFFRLRPHNFPTLRLSQFVQVIVKQDRLFSLVVNTPSIDQLRTFFQVAASDYWTTHYNFGTPSRTFPKKTTTAFINLLLINTVIPLIFCYRKYQGVDATEQLFELAEALKAEQNGITKKFAALGDPPVNSLESQGLLQLYNNYCSKSKCLQCAIGNEVLKRS